MADKGLRRMKRREILEMLLIQCQETERLQKELEELTERHEDMSESYERLKKKLDLKDERLNQKDAKLAELRREISELKADRSVEIAEVESLTEATLKLNGAFEEARRAAEQHLMKMGLFQEGKKYGC